MDNEGTPGREFVVVDGLCHDGTDDGDFQILHVFSGYFGTVDLYARRKGLSALFCFGGVKERKGEKTEGAGVRTSVILQCRFCVRYVSTAFSSLKLSFPASASRRRARVRGIVPVMIRSGSEVELRYDLKMV